MQTLTRETFKLSGHYVLEARDCKTGRLVARRKSKNLIVTVGKNQICQLLLAIGSPWTNGLTYQAIGTGTTTPTVADTQLATETARNVVTSRPSSASNQATFSTFFTAAQSTYFIKEVGIFGKDASGSANSGALFSRTLLSYDNSGGTTDITITYVLTVN